MDVLTLDVDLRLPASHSLKAKRSIVQSIVRTLDGWKGVGAAEVGYVELWQRTQLGVVVVGGSVAHVGDVADSVERHIWSVPDVEVISIDRVWSRPEA